MGRLEDRVKRLELASLRRHAPQSAVGGLAGEVRAIDREISELEASLDRTAFAEDEAYRKTVYAKLTSFLDLNAAIAWLEAEIAAEEENH